VSDARQTAGDFEFSGDATEVNSGVTDDLARYFCQYIPNIRKKLLTRKQHECPCFLSLLNLRMKIMRDN